MRVRSQRPSAFVGLGVASLLAALAACAHRAAPPPAAPPATVSVSSDAGAPDAPSVAVAPPPAVGPCADDDSACVRAAAERVHAALALLPGDLAGARSALAEARSPRAFAWRAYLAARAGDAEAATEALQHTGPENDGEVPGGVAAAALAAVRATTERETDADLADAPCAVFEWNGLEALVVFAPIHGSTRDGLAAGFKARCTQAAIDAALPPPRRAALTAAREALQRSLFAAFPRPEGTMFTAYAIVASERVADHYLALDYEAPARTEATLRAMVRGARAAALTRHLAAVRTHAPALGRAWCELARARGRTVDDAACLQRMRGAALSAAHGWMEGVVETAR